jgi:hypothetical protein
MYRHRATLCAALVLFVVGFKPLIAEESDSSKRAPANPTGTWKWERSFNQNKAEFTLKLNWDGKRLNGKYSAFDRTSDIEQAKLEKDQISFLAKREFNGNKFDVKFAGKVEPDNLVGKITVDFGNGPQEFDWNARRTVEIDDVIGVWDLRLQSPAGATDTAITPKLTISKSADGKLQGHSESVMGRFDAKNMVLKDNVLTWEIAGDGPNGKLKISYNGKLRGNAIEGENEFDFNGTKGTMKFTGKRQPPEEKKERKAADKVGAAPESKNESKASKP